MNTPRAFLVTLVGMALLMSLATATALEAKGWATVDYTILLAFHPKMAWYDFAVQRFYRPEVPLGNAKEMARLRAKADARTAEVQSRLAEVRRNRNRLLQELGNIDQQRQNTINEMMRDGKETGSIEESFARKKVRLQEEYDALDKEYLKVQEAGLDVFFLTRDDSRKYLAAIMSEIDAVLSRISSERGDLAILDRAFVTPPAVEYPAPVAMSGLNLTEASLYAQLLQSNFQLPPGSTDPSTPPDHAKRVAAGLESRFQEDFQKLLTQAPTVQPVIANLRARLFLAGGEDLTATALARIFETYKVPGDAANRILRLVPQLE
ncbi:MAG: hypothetical protein GX442_08130 [Candidatus Riflebacteria bacterium]|nr:hypothetical protein [Candidatus Riflebacteria bacterium]